MSDEKTLRDEFAMAALTGFLAKYGWDLDTRNGQQETEASDGFLAQFIAEECYELANAMLRARKETSEGDRG